MPLGGSKKVLVIDDSGLNRLQAKVALENKGYVVLELDNADDYFRFPWNYADAGLILLDLLRRPGMSGIDVLKRMQEYNCNPWPPVIIVSGNLDALTIADAIKLGAKDYLKKPFNDVDLLQRVERHFGCVNEYFIGKQLWSIYFMANATPVGTGVAVVDGDHIAGGIANFYFTGYCNLRSNPLSARLTATKFAPGDSVFGSSYNSYTVVMHGTRDNDKFTFSGHMEDYPENKMASVMKKLADL